MTASILIFNFYPVTAIMVVLLALLNDIPIMMIAYDNAPFALRPVRWDMTRVLSSPPCSASMGFFVSFGIFWIARDYLGLAPEVVQSLVFLKLLVAGHMTIYLTRNKGAIWERPWPSWKLIVACEATQIIGTLGVVYGWFVTPTGWELALMVWGYALVFFLITSVLKIGDLSAARPFGLPTCAPPGPHRRPRRRLMPQQIGRRRNSRSSQSTDQTRKVQ